MERITSFCIDHDRLKKGLYLSRIDGDVVTYDMRMCVPNQGVYLENAGLHTFCRNGSACQIAQAGDRYGKPEVVSGDSFAARRG